MTIEFTIYRTPAHLHALRLATGENVADSRTVELSAAEFPQSMREQLLSYAWGDEYPSKITRIQFDNDYEPSAVRNYGSEYLYVNAEEISAPLVADAWNQAMRNIEEKKRKAEISRAEITATRDAHNREQEAQSAKRVEAEKILAHRITTLENRAERAENRAEFLTEIINAIGENCLAEAIDSIVAGEHEARAEKLRDRLAEFLDD